MFSEEVRRLLIQVITSWQVLAVTVILIIYFCIVSYVARVYYRRPRRPAAFSGGAEKSEDFVTSESDDLGLEEQTSEKTE